MNGPRFIGPEAEASLDWIALADAIVAGHARPRAEMRDSFATRGSDTILTRTAWIDGLGQLVKAVTVFPENTTHPKVNGGVQVFSDVNGTLEAVLDFHLVTKWKTAADSLVAARLLAPPQVATILIAGAGAVARSLIEAYGAAFPKAEFLVWNRTPAHAKALEGPRVRAVSDLQGVVEQADLIATATMATEPVIKGGWLRPGQHLDLIGAYKAGMREVDDDALRGARLFADSMTSAAHIGEFADPVERGILSWTDVTADYYDLARFVREPGDITLSKNAGGAHLDLITSRYILDAVGS